MIHKKEACEVKRVFKKNQIIIAALAVMIAVAGYLNYSGKIFLYCRFFDYLCVTIPRGGAVGSSLGS